MKHFDIIIVGGGMVGLAMAKLLSEHACTVCLIDQGPISKALTDITEPRVSAINAQSQQMLNSVGAWQHIQADRLCAYTHMQVWEKDSFGRIDFAASETEHAQLGHIIENQNIVNALAAVSTNNLTVLEHTSIERIDISDQLALVHTSKQLLAGKLLIGADGANSIVRKAAQLPISFWHYDHTAIVSTVQTSKPHEHAARQAFTPTGPLAFLPLNDQNHCSIVWSQDTDEANRLMQLPAADFERELAVAIDMQLGPCELLSERVSVPLSMRYARQWVGERVVLIGDAAHTIHPLAGQGVNLGFQDAIALAQALRSVSADALGQRSALRAFERERKAQTVKMIATMEGFKQLFSGANPLKKWVRGTGMQLFNHAGGIKRSLIAQAMQG
ncbi:FAD-dependent monooxygenase [Alteromonas oceanisediminis]|uniref:FAD-dependent monooxygenase n=1 Tax=Alteromonas oceanisediminis TaxID=2836180 RepID=UPI001BDA0EE3|nr:FAD-dependent monooxygenase [Alteromonas oceanisediminis]MBT0585565.1 FAD-dependent monooxygenase [Alteromonas oceanisediminis]